MWQAVGLAFLPSFPYRPASNSFGRGLNGGFFLWKNRVLRTRPPVFPLFARLL